MSADAVDFRLDVLHGELVFGHQVDFVLQTVNEVQRSVMLITDQKHPTYEGKDGSTDLPELSD